MTFNYSQLLLVCVISTSTRAYIVICPSSLIAGNEETILVINNKNEQLKGEIVLEDNPNFHKDDPYDAHPVDVEPGELALVKFRVKERFTRNIDVRTTLNGTKKVKTLRASRKLGFVFLQTDKPIYNPTEEMVHIRFMATDEDLKPANRTYRLQIKNPSGQLVMSHDFYDVGKSLFSYNYSFPEDPPLGEWLLLVLYGKDFKQSERLMFVMQEYILPTFKVQVTTPETLVPSMNVSKVTVRASHIYGGAVRGQVMIREFLMTALGDTREFDIEGSFNSTGEEIEGRLRDWTKLDEAGTAEIQVELDHYKNSSRWKSTVLGRRHFVQALVVEDSTSRQETSYSDESVFENELFRVVSYAQQEIRPGYPALVSVELTHARGQPATDVPVKIKAFDGDSEPISLPESKTHSDKTGFASFVVPTKTSDTQISYDLEIGRKPFRSAFSKTMEAYKGEQYIVLGKPPFTKKFQVNEKFESNLYFHPEGAFQGALVAVIAAGRIVLAQIIEPEHMSGEEVYAFRITPSMSPKSRVIALAWTNDSDDVVIDSFTFNIEDDCGKAAYQIRQSILRRPGGIGVIEIAAQHRGTVVGLVAVDEAVYTSSREKYITKESIFSRFRLERDRGCRDGGGHDLMTSARTAGLVVFTDQIDVDYGESCLSRSQRQRERRATFADQYSDDPLGKRCCRLAFTGYAPRKSCKERREALTDEFSKDNQRKLLHCQKAFYDCCMRDDFGYVVLHEQNSSLDSRKLASGRGLGAVEDIEDISEIIPEENIRDDFRESFLFHDIEMDEDTKQIFVSLPHSVTTWSFQSVAVNPKGGICAAPALRVALEQYFFLQVDMPYKVVQNEHVLIPVSVFNYRSKVVWGNLHINGMDGVCTQARPGMRSEALQFEVKGNAAFKLNVPVFPLKAGRFPLKFEAIGSDGSDAIVKELYVIPEGRQHSRSFSIAIDPTNVQGRKNETAKCGPGCESVFDPDNGNQTITIDMKLPDDVVEGTARVTLSAVGDPVGGKIDVITHPGLYDAEDKFVVSKACAEHNMMRLVLLVYALEHGKSLGKLDSTQETEIKENLMTAYSRQMQFRKKDGSFKFFTKTSANSSVYLTSLVARTFCRASQFFNDSQMFSATALGALKWLISEAEDDGSFYEVKPNLHTALMGGIVGKVALTSHVVPTLEECENLVASDSIRSKYLQVLSSARVFLMKHYDKVEDGYRAALVAFALSKTNYSSLALERMQTLMQNDSDSNTVALYSWPHMNALMDLPKPEVPEAGPLKRGPTLSGPEPDYSEVPHESQSVPPSNVPHESRSPAPSEVSEVNPTDPRNREPGLPEVDFEKPEVIDRKNPWKIEGTAYALLAATRADRKSYARQLYNWLCSQQDLLSFDSTQDTVVSLQAMGEFLTRYPEEPADLELHVNDGKSGEKLMRIAKETVPLLQTHVVDVSSRELRVHATGKGYGLLSVRIEYNELIPTKEKCPFDVTVLREIVDYDDDEEDALTYNLNRSESSKTVHHLAKSSLTRKRTPVRYDQLLYNVTVCAYLMSRTATALSLVQIDTVTGFEALEQDLEELSNEMQIASFDNFPDHVTLYVSEFEPQKNTCFSLRYVQQFSTGNSQPAAVSVHDYYNRNFKCLVPYTLGGAHRSIMDCNSDRDKMCKCLQNSCPPVHPFEVQLKANLSNVRIGRITAESIICKHEFVIEGEVLGMLEHERALFWKINVTYAWREKTPMVGKVITFIQKSHCKVQMAQSLTYMVFGLETDTRKGGERNESRSYNLDENTKVFRPKNKGERAIAGSFQLLKSYGKLCE